MTGRMDIQKRFHREFGEENECPPHDRVLTSFKEGKIVIVGRARTSDLKIDENLFRNAGLIKARDRTQRKLALEEAAEREARLDPLSEPSRCEHFVTSVLPIVAESEHKTNELERSVRKTTRHIARKMCGGKPTIDELLEIRLLVENAIEPQFICANGEVRFKTIRNKLQREGLI